MVQHLDKEQIESRIAAITDQNSGQKLDPRTNLRDCTLSHDTLSLSIELGYPANSDHARLKTAIQSAMVGLGANKVQVDIVPKITAHAVQKGVNLLNGIKNIIAIASGKGGVGKSTTAINLALALQAEGASVGLLDADIYGPSQPRMLGCHQKPDSPDGKKLHPLIRYSLQTMSIGYLIEEDTPMIWRGPMVTSALTQLLNDTVWQDLDYLIIDLPPGTGDIQLTLCQKIPVSGALIVTTPQDIALIDARKALKMFEKIGVSVLGVIENMSLHICSQCGHQEHIFGQGGGQQMAAQYNIDLLGMLPLDINIREGSDQGKPSVALAPDSPISQLYKAIARKAAARLALQPKDYSAKFPKIVIENTASPAGQKK